MSARKKTERMSRSPRNQPAPAARRGRRHEPLPPARPASQGLGAVALDNPVAAGGWLVMALTGGLIIANALVFQSGRHPAPFFATREAPVSAPAAPVVTEAQLERQRLVRDIQVELRRLGMYGGLLDGLNGPATERGVRAYQRARGLPETGDIDTALLARLAMDTGADVDNLPPLPPLPPQTAPGHSSSGQPSPAASSASNPSTGSVRTTRVTPPVPSPSAPRAQTVSAPANAGPVPPASVGSNALSGDRARIARLQAALSEMGYGPISVDGFAGEQTANAIRRFELDRGLAITGALGPMVEQEVEKVLGRPL
ncbi:Peptidoglycan-binding (PGRP) domain of peptidoglycan hydrolases-containing protein [Stappia indica]|uniref:Peptidoglycan-binding (PGRP) domain of peptidoglycan hydrolases-containing protein n=2 Tax=Stappia indica TaxID=538381 RepID=A0A285RSG2_9HYPH|nr:Peptidoglycan-binding (PGRP) domain of peptidoglycan hydrolases-containing protein [Stappia indica]